MKRIDSMSALGIGLIIWAAEKWTVISRALFQPIMPAASIHQSP
jgi:hypothetical protein